MLTCQPFKVLHLWCVLSHLSSDLLFSTSLAPVWRVLCVVFCVVLLCVAVCCCVLCVLGEEWEREGVCIDHVPVCTGTTRTCVSTSARGAGTHGDVLNVHTETF